MATGLKDHLRESLVTVRNVVAFNLRLGKPLLLAAAVLAVGSSQATAVDYALPGPFAVGKSVVSVPRPGGGTFQAEFYYPATANGDNTPFNPAGGQYAGVAFGHGFLVPPDLYASTLRHLAGYGYFVIAPTTQTGLLPSHDNFKVDLIQSLDYLTTLNATASSPYFGHVDTNAYGYSGHSMGGGVSVLAGSEDPRTKAVVPLQPIITFTNPDSVEIAPNLKAPVLYVGASEDIITATNLNALPMYNNSPAPKQLGQIQGGSHGGTLDRDYLLILTEGSLPREEQLEATRNEMTSWFNLYLKGDQNAWRQTWGPEAPVDSRFALQSVASGIGLGASGASGTVNGALQRTYALTVTNNSTRTQSYSLLTEDNQWSGSFSAPQTPVLAPGQSAVVNFTVTAPQGAAVFSDTALVSARSDLDGGTRSWLRLTTSLAPTVARVTSPDARAVFNLDAAGNYSVAADAGDGLFTPLGLAEDSAGNAYIADSLLAKVFKLAPNGAVTLLADASQGVTNPTGLNFNSSGNLLVANYLTNSITSLSPSGLGSLLAGLPQGVSRPFDVVADNLGNVYVSNLDAGQIIKIDGVGNATLLADAADGLFSPISLAVDGAGALYVADVLTSKILKFDSVGNATVFADLGDGLATPTGIAFDAAGNLLVADYLGNAVRRFTPAGVGSLFSSLQRPWDIGIAPGAGSFMATPEPSSLALLTLGAAVCLAARRRRANRAARWRR